MSEKRRDNHNRILHVGESQRPDGRYAYKYKDLNGDVKFVYSWRLDKKRPGTGWQSTRSFPAGKRTADSAGSVQSNRP